MENRSPLSGVSPTAANPTTSGVPESEPSALSIDPLHATSNSDPQPQRFPLRTFVQGGVRIELGDDTPEYWAQKIKKDLREPGEAPLFHFKSSESADRIFNLVII